MKIGLGAWPTRDHGEKSEKHLSFPPVFLNNWLNSCVRGQFEIKMLIVLDHSDINPTFHMNFNKWACNHLKPVTCQRIPSKNTRPGWVDTWARDKVRWNWSADTLFWQLSIDNNTDVQSVFSWALWAPKAARKCESKHWYNCGADGRAEAVYGHVITKFSGMGKFTYPLCSAGALRAGSFAKIPFLVVV